MPAEKIECNRWSYADSDEKFMQRFEERYFMSASDARRSHRLLSSGSNKAGVKLLSKAPYLSLSYISV